MQAENKLDYKNNIVEEIIDNATGLPMEEQSQLLMLAKGMAYTRKCIMKEGIANDAKQSYVGF